MHRQIAVITGGGQGLGRAIAQKLSTQNIQLVLLDLSESLLAEAEAEIDHVLATFCVDVTDEKAIQTLVPKIIENWGRIDILINSAGITGHTNLRSHQVDFENLRRVMDVNFYGSWITAKSILPYMLDQGYGRILHIASIAGKEGNAGMLAYSASKAAVIGMTKVQGKEYAETGITINALAPAVIRTAMVDNMPDEQVKYMTDKIPMKRCGTLEEIAHLAAFIVSPENSFTTGFTYDLSGGRATY